MKIPIVVSLLITIYSTLYHCYGQNSITLPVSEKPKINVIGVGTVTTFPDAAQITISLRFVKPALRDAINENQKVAAQVLAILKNYVPDTNEIKVSLISTSKLMKYDNGLKKEVFTGFESSQKIIFTLKDLTQIQVFTEEILKTRIYEIERVSYFHTRAADFVKEAQGLAVTDALETTRRLAEAGNISPGKIIFLQTSNSPAQALNQTVNSYHFQTFNKGMGGEGVTSGGQLITYTVQVSMFTEIQ
jgi:uncharacterized protein